MTEGPRLLVEWEPAHRGFTSSFAAVLQKAPRREPGLFVPYGVQWGAPVASLCLHLVVVAVLVLASPLIALLTKQPLPNVTSVQVLNFSKTTVFYSAASLPQVNDAGGAERGKSGASGGNEYFHPTQTIRIARGNRLVPRVVDAPRLRLPQTKFPAANLLAVAPYVPPAPAAAVASRAANAVDVMPSLVIAPAPRVDRPSLVLPVSADVVPPAPNVPVANVSAMAASAAVVPSAPETRSTMRAVDVAATLRGTSSDVVGMPNGSDISGALIISVESGTVIGIPEGGPGSLAMSPSGRGAGVGGSGGGTGIGHGTGSGSGMIGGGPGGNDSGSGYGSNPGAHGGTSLSAGPGGSGTGTGGRPSIAPGVTISGGVVHLPSFAGSGSRSVASAKMPHEQRQPPGVIVIASPRSGGGLAAYGELKGERVYTIYLESRSGPVVMQYADPQSNGGFQAELSAPEPLMVDLPGKLTITDTIIRCTLSRAGVLRDMRVLRSHNAERVKLLLKAIEHWRFRPVIRGEDAIDAEAILGFGVETR